MTDYAKWDKLAAEVKLEEEKEKAEKPPENPRAYVEKLRQGQTQLGDKKLDMTAEVREPCEHAHGPYCPGTDAADSIRRRQSDSERRLKSPNSAACSRIIWTRSPIPTTER
jgi:hypothetical protein